jgi:hypothetical protein
VLDDLREWWQFAADVYLDHRHRNWTMTEETGAVRFIPIARVVLVHRTRARHIAEALGAGPEIERLEALVTLPAPARPEPGPLPPPSAVDPAGQAPTPAVTTRTTRCWRDVVGWLGMVAGAAVFLAALAVPLDDPALVVALMLAVRSGRMILDGGPSTRPPREPGMLSRRAPGVVGLARLVAEPRRRR